MAQEPHGFEEHAAEPEAAGPAEAGFQFFPRAAAEEIPVEAEHVESNSLMIDTGSPSLDDQAWSATERFSKRGFLEVIPTQYPLDNSPYEGEGPQGESPDQEPGKWRDSSVQRPEPELAIEDQPWVEWHKVTFQAQTLPTSDKGLGMTSLDLRGTLKFARWPFLFVTPRAGWNFLDGPPTPDLPGQLIDFSLDTTVYLPVNDRWTFQLSAAPGIYTDGKATRDSFRMTGRGMVLYRWSPQLQLAGGYIHLGRKDIVGLPIAGLVYTPTDDLKFDIMFPKPRIGYRYQHDTVRERWVYFSGELGGGSWAVRRASGADDVASYRDWELLVGIEHKEPKAVNWQLEGGYVFNRRIEYISKSGDADLPGTAVLRVILSY